MIYAVGSLTPQISANAFVHPDATIIGDVTVGPDSSVWPQAVLRGDAGPVIVGAQTSVQDGSVLTATGDNATRIGDACVVGHLANITGSTVEGGCLVGTRSTLLEGVTVHAGAVIAASALIPQRTEIPAGAMAIGVPAAIRLGEGEAKRAMVEAKVANYVALTRRYRSELRRVDNTA
jgi:carbonic anhydrase/acetyltransferase-like protein (isoleucine patch superfamily)